MVALRGGAAPEGVAGRVVGAAVGLDLDDAAGPVAAHQHLVQQIGRHLARSRAGRRRRGRTRRRPPRRGAAARRSRPRRGAGRRPPDGAGALDADRPVVGGHEDGRAGHEVDGTVGAERLGTDRRWPAAGPGRQPVTAMEPPASLGCSRVEGEGGLADVVGPDPRRHLDRMGARRETRRRCRGCGAARATSMCFCVRPPRRTLSEAAMISTPAPSEVGVEVAGRAGGSPAPAPGARGSARSGARQPGSPGWSAARRATQPWRSPSGSPVGAGPTPGRHGGGHGSALAR